MFKLIVLLIINTCIVFGSQLPKDCGKSLNPSLFDWKVVGGRDAKVGEFPWFSLLSLAKENKKYPQSNDFCGGAIINEEWILTAAHCIAFDANEPIKVRLGVHNMSLHEKEEVDINITKSILHPHWNGSTIRGDIALLKLAKKIDFNVEKQLRPICLAKTETKLTKKCMAYGFGNTNNTHPQQPANGILKKLDQIVSEPTVCKKAEPYLFDSTTEVCVVSMGRGGHAICDGDSGGPLQCLGEDGRAYQVGIVSYGSSYCGAPQSADVYTKVSAYVDWIENTIQKY